MRHLLALLLCCPLLHAQLGMDMGDVALDGGEAPASDPWAGYVFAESFEDETYGYENTPYSSSGTIDFKATDQYFNGSQSMKVAAPAVTTTAYWNLPTSYQRVSGRFNLRISTQPSLNGNHFWQLYDSSGNQIVGLYLSSRLLVCYLKLSGGGDGEDSTDNAISDATWTTIYWEYIQGEGGGTSFKAGWSTDGNKTATAGNILEVTGKTSTWQGARIRHGFRSADTTTQWYDAIVVDTKAWADLPNGLPDGM